MIDVLKSLYKRDLEKLREEIGLYRDESAIWKVGGDITNSAGNLCLHLTGNLNHFIGAELGKSGYIRQRDLEFSTTGTSREGLFAMIDETIPAIENALDQVSEEDLTAEYPLVVFRESMTTGWFLMHLATHFNYHLGQINYHRRIFDQSDAS